MVVLVLSELPALRAPAPFSPLIQHSVRVAWAAAETEHAGHRWHAGRELALEPRRWATEVANERGGRSRRLPDLVFWPRLDDTVPVAVVVVRGLPNARRERAALEGWQAAIAAGRYAQVRYLAGPCVASRLQRLASDVGLVPTQFIVDERVVTDDPPAPPEVIEGLTPRTGGLAAAQNLRFDPVL